MSYINLELTEFYKESECPHHSNCQLHRYKGTIPPQKKVDLMRCGTHKSIFVMRPQQNTSLFTRICCFK